MHRARAIGRLGTECDVAAVGGDQRLCDEDVALVRRYAPVWGKGGVRQRQQERFVAGEDGPVSLGGHVEADQGGIKVLVPLIHAIPPTLDGAVAGGDDDKAAIGSDIYQGADEVEFLEPDYFAPVWPLGGCSVSAWKS